MAVLWIVGYFCISFFSTVLSSGRTIFECPDGFYLSSIESLYENGKRMYGYSCATMSLGQQVSKENCEANNVMSTTTGDMYLSCNSSQQYVVGVSIVDYNDYQTWSLSCCESSAIRFDLTQCSLTPFVNEHQKSFHFQVDGKHLMTKWQSIYDETKNDRRWWIQTCPYEIDSDSTSSKTSIELAQSQTKNQFVTSHVGKKFDEPARRYKSLINLKSKDSWIKGTTLLPISSSTPAITYDDYYDPDGIMKREKLMQKHGEPVTNEIFKNLHKIFKTIQDGLVFFQWALNDNGQSSEVPLPLKSFETSNHLVSNDVTARKV